MGILLKRKTKGDLIFDICNNTFMVLFCISIIFPFWDMIMLSFSHPDESVSLTLRLWPKSWRWDAYLFAFSDSKILNAYAVTILRTVLGTLLHIFVTLLAAYPLSKRNLPFRNVLTTYFIIPMFFSGGLIPTYLINKKLGFVDNILVYIIPGAVSIFVVLLVRNYLMSMDSGLEESAFIDGAGYVTILFKIIAPLAKPIIATIALWQAVAHWNAWMDCMIYIRDERKIVMQIILRRMMDLTNMESKEMQNFIELDSTRQITSETVKAAVTIITILPIIMVYPFLQKYFVKGIMVGALKG